MPKLKRNVLTRDGFKRQGEVVERGSITNPTVFEDEEQASPEEDPEDLLDGLSDLSVQELRDLASEREVDLQGAGRKDEIIARIRDS